MGVFSFRHCARASPVHYSATAQLNEREFTPIWRLLRRGRAELCHHEEWQKVNQPNSARSVRNTVLFPRAQFVDLRRSPLRQLKWARPVTARTLRVQTALRLDNSTASSIPYLDAGCGRMPKSVSCLRTSVKPEPYQHHWSPRQGYDRDFHGWAYPPNDYGKWGNWSVTVDKHSSKNMAALKSSPGIGIVWNESDIGYWRGTPQEFAKAPRLCDRGVRRALPQRKWVGQYGSRAAGRFTRRFSRSLACARHQVPT